MSTLRQILGVENIFLNGFILRFFFPVQRQYFMEYSKMYVYRNGSLMLSDWAPYGNILNLVNNFKSTNNVSLLYAYNYSYEMT